jgi:DNA (cytosine-5)-methyltransferase 1
MNKMTFGSLFAGIGGVDLGFERAGMECKWQVENDPFCIRVLTKHWPHIKRFGDIREIKGPELEAVDLIVGGFPCQPFSLASNKRKETEDERWLWPEMFRIVKIVQPPWVVCENVMGFLQHGLPIVLDDLQRENFEVLPMVLPASAFGAHHERKRIIVVAYSDQNEFKKSGRVRGGPANSISGISLDPTMENSRREHGKEGPPKPGSLSGITEDRQAPDNSQRPDKVVHTERQGLEGVFYKKPEYDLQPTFFDVWQEWEAEPRMDRVAYGLPDQVDRLTSLGNAVVPRVAEWVATQILKFS